MSKLTCYDCKHCRMNDDTDHYFCTKCFLNVDALRICHWFDGKDGKRPRFCRLASSVDEMAAALVDWYYADGHKHWTYTGSIKSYDSRKDALAAAKQYLMEVE